jgi:catechol 2,3-dioxygenase
VDNFVQPEEQIMNSLELHPDVRIGHVHLRVSDLDRATAFYRDVLGLTLVVDGVPFGLPMRLLAAGDYHHHVAINTFESRNATPPPAGHTGLYHFALLYPDSEALTRAVARLRLHGYPIDDARDHGASVSVYLRDPDGNGIELTYDRPRADWFDAQGRPNLRNDALDPRDLLQHLQMLGA